ncbi:MAG TPA: hypothetical protein DEB31_06425 [Clostridiales bacterium]|nr:hypothetical protein [Clostridiales bacterium]
MNNINWRKRDTLALFVIPLEFLLGWLFVTFVHINNPNISALIPFIAKLISLVLIIILFHELLASDGRDFKKRLWLKLLICLGIAFLMRFVLSGVRGLLHIPQSAETLKMLTGGLPYGLFLLASFTPVLAPITEEVVFRHVLFYKFKDSRVLRVIMCIVSAFAFGAIHFNNFSGNLLLTVPYMVIALLYNLIYYFTGNIWYSTTIHLIFNFSQSVIPALSLPFIAGGIS